MNVELHHGGGTASTSDLINKFFIKHFNNEILEQLDDSAIISQNQFTNVSSIQSNETKKLISISEFNKMRLAFTTDSFVVTPIFFAGGDIGRLAICGTVNDLSVMGAIPKFLSCSFILEEGLSFEDLEKICISMKTAADEAGIQLVTGDTKVIEKTNSSVSGLFINTSGIGLIPDTLNIGSANIKENDVIIISGNLGDHHATIYSERMGITNNIMSDVAPLVRPIHALLSEKIDVHCMRDITRGGVVTVLNELASKSSLDAKINSKLIPCSPDTKGLCDLLGLDILALANEGKFIAVVNENDADRALDILAQQPLSSQAKIVGHFHKGSGLVKVISSIGGERILSVPWSEGLPRIC